MKPAPLLVLLALGCGYASPAAAQQPTRDPVSAELLFDVGKSLLQKGDWPGACAKFQASMDLDPAVGTLLKIAKCHEHDKKLSIAWYDYQRALVLNREKKDQSEQRRAELDEFTKKQIAALEPRVPRIRVSVAERPPGLKVTRDGQEIPASALGEALPVDPGPHEIVAEAPGRRTERRPVTVDEGKTEDVALTLVREAPPPLATAAPPPPAASAPPAIAPAPAQPQPDAAPSSEPGQLQRSAGLVVAGLGVVGIGVSIGLFAATSSKVGESNAFCDETNHCQPDGLALRGDARTLQAAGLVTLAVGAGAAAAGIVLYATAPKKASVALTPAGAAATVRW